jgi:Peptidase family M28
MKKFYWISVLFAFPIFQAFSQTNILSTNPLAKQIMLGNYDPAIYTPGTGNTDPDSLITLIHQQISADTLKKYLEILSTFQNRNSGSDTVSLITGIGAARRWYYSEFVKISQQNQGRLIPSYLQFDRNICSVGQHRNIFAVLPGLDTSDRSFILLEAHIDSRCDVLCDIGCVAEGMEDNASGTALVLELARVMSQYSFDHTIVFMATIAEEQGLYGADAFANYALQNGLLIKAVLNNDVIGGVICGQTSSPPSCPGLNHIDSTQVRLFSQGGFNSRNKGLSRFLKLEYKEELLPKVTVPMVLSIMAGEDRTGRGGDHIPFRQSGYAAMRFSSANENGNASNGPGYIDRQHTSGDVLGLDLDSNGTLDTFFVDFNYLARNAAINAVGSITLGIGPETPNFAGSLTSGGSLKIEITGQTQYPQYRVGLRSSSNDWDSVYTLNSIVDSIVIDSSISYKVSVASVDSDGIESLFSQEKLFLLTGLEPGQYRQDDGITLLQNRPNPFDEATIISFLSSNRLEYNSAEILIIDQQGNILERIPTEIKDGVNEVLYTHGYTRTGILVYQLRIDGKVIESKKMVFAN